MSHSHGHSPNSRCLSANSSRASFFQKSSEPGAILVVKFTDIDASLSDKEGFHLWNLQQFSEDHTAAVLGHPQSVGQVFEAVKAWVWSPCQSQGCHLLCSDVWLHRSLVFVVSSCISIAPRGYLKCEGSVCGGQSYWKTAVTAPVVTEHLTLAVCGVIRLTVGETDLRQEGGPFHKSVLEVCTDG